MNKHLLICVAAVAFVGQLALANDPNQQQPQPQYLQADYYDQQQQFQQFQQQQASGQPLDYNAPAVAPGQLARGEIRHSITGNVKNLASVLGQSAKRTLQEATPALLGIKNDLAKGKDRILANPRLARVRDVIPTRETIKQAAAAGQERIGKRYSDFRARHPHGRYANQQQQQQLPQGLPQPQAPLDASEIQYTGEYQQPAREQNY